MHAKSQTLNKMKSIRNIIEGKRFIIAKAFKTDEGIKLKVVGLVESLNEASHLADFWQCKVIAFRIDYIVEINPSQLIANQ